MTLTTRDATPADYPLFARLFPELAVADRLYLRCGFRDEGPAWAIRVPWSVADALSRDSTTTPFKPAPSDDVAIAERFGIPKERLALLRGRPGVAFVALARDGETVAFASVDPAYPGTYPFRARGGEMAGSLLAALRPLADHARFDFIHVTVEEDVSVMQALTAGGAELLYEVTRMGAKL
jgi:hypothetical protein